MTLDPFRKCSAEWLVIAFGFATICVVLAFCLWRLISMNDAMARREATVSRVLENQATIISTQREILSILHKYR